MPKNKGVYRMELENGLSNDIESRKQGADLLRDLAELLEDPAVEVKPMNINIKQSRDTIAEFERGKSIVQLTRDISIEIETREIIKSL